MVNSGVRINFEKCGQIMLRDCFGIGATAEIKAQRPNSLSGWI